MIALGDLVAQWLPIAGYVLIGTGLCLADDWARARLDGSASGAALETPPAANALGDRTSNTLASLILAESQDSR